MSLAQTSCDLIHWAVDHTLRNMVTVRSGLGLIPVVAGSVDELDIFTLNHDTLIEEELLASGLSFESGFGDQFHGGFSVYQPGWRAKRSGKSRRIFKLHGSLNWYLYQFPGWARQYAVLTDIRFTGAINKAILVNPVEWKAAFLSGTIVKEQRYGQGFWGDLLSTPRTSLETPLPDLLWLRIRGPRHQHEDSSVRFATYLGITSSSC